MYLEKFLRPMHVLLATIERAAVADRTYSNISGALRIVITMQLANMVSITSVLNNEWINMRMAMRRMRLNGDKMKQARDELNRKMVMFRLITTKTC
jgi:hypothetical protein